MGGTEARDDLEPAVYEWRVGQPSEALRGLVGSYVAYQEEGGAPGLHRGLPSGSITFIVSVGEPIRIVGSPSGRATDDVHRATVGGLHTSPALIRHGGNQCGVAITLHPNATRALFGLPAAALAGASVELADLIGSDGDQLWDRLQEASSATQRFAICDEVLTPLADRLRIHDTAPELIEAWRLLDHSDGGVRVADLAAHLGWSRQHLGRRFRAEYGIGPKAAAKVFRFDRSVGALKGSWSGSLASLAADCGYADQSHLTNDWNDLAGCTPTEWLATEQVPFVQDDDLALV